MSNGLFLYGLAVLAIAAAAAGNVSASGSNSSSSSNNGSRTDIRCAYGSANCTPVKC